MENYNYKEIRNQKGDVIFSVFSNQNVIVLNFQDGTDKVIFRDGGDAQVAQIYAKLMLGLPKDYFNR